MIHRHVLHGCKSRPLASHLKSLGILRLLAEQKDPLAKGWWEGECFAISTDMDRDEIEAFWCEMYAPTPIVAPWHGGSGFYPGDAMEGIEAISESEACRARASELFQALTNACAGVASDRFTMVDRVWVFQP